MFRSAYIAALLAASLAVPAVAAEKAAPPVKKGLEAATQAGPDDMICTYEQRIGSHLKRRVCTSRKQRDEQAQQDQEALRKAQRRGKGYGGAQDPAGL